MPIGDVSQRIVEMRQAAVGRTIELSLRSISGAASLHPGANPARHGVEVVRDIPYQRGGDRAHLLDVWRPLFGPPKKPVVLYLHGGGFRILSKETHWMMALGFARKGYVVVNANYRLAPRHPYPAAVEDAVAAFEWTLDHVSRYGGDPNDLVVAGESAGGNLTSTLAVACTFERPEPFARRLFERGVVPRAAVPLCGFLEVSNAERFLDDTSLPIWVRDRVHQICQAYLGVHVHAPEHERDLADPLRVLESDREPARPLPPFFASVGERDPIVEDTRRLERALAARGVKHEVLYYPNEGHAFQAFVFKDSAKDAFRKCIAFLEEARSG